VTSRAQAAELVARLTALVDRFLDLEVTALPHIPADPCVAESAQIGIPVAIHAPDAPSVRALRQVVRALGTLTQATNTWWRTAAHGDRR
jgi:MinD-like ATPase involved in chromosome partitioning or flagellar assembly